MLGGGKAQSLERALAWGYVAAWTAILAATDLVLATCEVDCSDSGIGLGLLLLALLGPLAAIGALHLIRSGLNERGRRALVLLGVVCAGLVGWLVTIFTGIP